MASKFSPQGSKIAVSTDTTASNELRLSVHMPLSDQPPGVDQFLMAHGWTCSHVTHGDHQDPLWTRYDANDEQSANPIYYRWFEAIAFQYYLDMTIGGLHT